MEIQHCFESMSVVVIVDFFFKLQVPIQITSLLPYCILYCFAKIVFEMKFI